MARKRTKKKTKKKKNKGLSPEGEAALRDLRARQRSWVALPLADWREEEDLVVIAAPRFKGRLGKGLIEVPQADQSVNGEGSVPEPGVAVVPVPYTTYVLG